MTARMTTPRIVVRANVIWDARYMQPDGTWGEYETARRFKDQDAAEAAAEAAKLGPVGLFPISVPRRIKE